MGWAALWMLIPDEALVLIIVGIAFALMFGLVSGRAALGLVLGLVVLPILLAPFIELVLAGLPAWASLLVLLALALALLRALVAIFLGQRGSAHFVAILAADVVKVVFLAPFRIVRWVVRRTVANSPGPH